ncbi:MAG: GLPGLI family protein [Muribaculaceae bacterium]|nr:GLPGLI family protein [Muribaculaceae bacterium]
MKRLLTYIILALATVAANADNWVRDTEPAILEVHYTRTQVTDTTKRETDFFKEETMLRIGQRMSRYCSVPKFYDDSLRTFNSALYWERERIAFESTKDQDPRVRDMDGLARRGRYWSVIYKNYPDGKVTETSYFEMENWRYEEDWEKPSWEITDESKEIIGYQCFKASTYYRGRRWTAWFTPEIPIQEGPWKLCGLPGLILEAEDNHSEYHFVANGLKQNGIAEVGFLCYQEKRGVNTVTRDKFFNNWWKYVNSNFGAKMAAIYGNGPQPEDNVKKEQNRDKEETNYPHDL